MSTPAGPTGGSTGPGNGSAPPDGGALSVELEALRTDAELWHRAAGELTDPRTRVAGMTLTAPVLSLWAVDAGLDQSYEQVRGRMEALLGQGAGAFDTLGTSLTTAADTYQREDAAGAHQFSGLRPGG